MYIIQIIWAFSQKKPIEMQDVYQEPLETRPLKRLFIRPIKAPHETLFQCSNATLYLNGRNGDHCMIVAVNTDTEHEVSNCKKTFSQALMRRNIRGPTQAFQMPKVRQELLISWPREGT